MKLDDTKRVDEHAIRPAGEPGKCFYCQQPLAGEHNPACVMMEQTVVVDFTIRMVMRVPADWDKEMIEFRYNDSTWCSSNLIEDLVATEKEHERNGSCFCDRTSAKFIREATEDDHARYGFLPRS